jgi:hypothetical protein
LHASALRAFLQDPGRLGLEQIIKTRFGEQINLVGLEADAAAGCKPFRPASREGGEVGGH